MGVLQAINRLLNYFRNKYFVKLDGCRLVQCLAFDMFGNEEVPSAFLVNVENMGQIGVV